MAFTMIDELITPQKLRDFVDNELVDYHGEEMDEPYTNAGYCVCFVCQDIAPRMLSAADRIGELELASTQKTAFGRGD